MTTTRWPYLSSFVIGATSYKNESSFILNGGDYVSSSHKYEVVSVEPYPIFVLLKKFKLSSISHLYFVSSSSDIRQNLISLFNLSLKPIQPYGFVSWRLVECRRIMMIYWGRDDWEEKMKTTHQMVMDAYERSNGHWSNKHKWWCWW